LLAVSSLVFALGRTGVLGILALATILGAPKESFSEFIQTSAGVLQSSDRRAKIIVSYRVPGIFILLGSPIDLQVFDPAKIELQPSKVAPVNLPTGNPGSSESGSAPHAPQTSAPQVPAATSTHLFVEYSPELDRYTALHIGQRSFRIRGGFSLHSDAEGQRLRITVDNNNPYLSVVYEPVENSAAAQPAEPSLAPRDNSPTILGFRGIQTVVNKSGLRYVALLEANQFNQFKGLIEPYVLADGAITLKGSQYQGNSIGVELEPQKNICLAKGSSLIYQSQLSGIKGSANRETALKELENLLAAAKPQDPFKGVLLLRVNPTEILGLDYGKERVITVRPLPKAKQSVCLIEETPLG
jgi:hypothetical protein